MGDLVNLRQKRKDLARAEKEKRAEANRRKFGQTKSEKAQHKLQDALDRARLDAHKVDPRRED